MIADICFYLFAGVLLLAAVGVISARNPVHSVLFLILAFFNAAVLMIFIGAEYIAMTLIIVYVGAVAVLLLFVVMMLDIDIAKTRAGFVRYLPFGISAGMLILAEIVYVFSISAEHLPGGGSAAQAQAKTTNTEMIGNLLYTDYALPFQISALILLVAMIGAIVLTHRRRPGVIRQSVSDQVGRKRSESVEVVQVTSRQGVL